MTKLSKREIDGWKLKLSQPHSPDEMIDDVDRLSDRLGFDAMILAGMDFFRDAHTVANFAKSITAKDVKLCSRDRPDFEITFLDGRSSLFECTETVIPGRKRGDEYKQSKEKAVAGHPLPESDPYMDWEQNRREATNFLHEAAKLKADKKYDPAWGLVILLQLRGFPDKAELVVAQRKPAPISAKNVFPKSGFFGRVSRIHAGKMEFECTNWQRLTILD